MPKIMPQKQKKTHRSGFGHTWPQIYGQIIAQKKDPTAVESEPK